MRVSHWLLELWCLFLFCCGCLGLTERALKAFFVDKLARDKICDFFFFYYLPRYSKY